MNTTQSHGCAKRVLAIAVVATAALSACSYVPGTEAELAWFTHTFRALDSNGEAVGGSNFVVTLSDADFGLSWSEGQELSDEGRVDARRLMPLRVEAENIEFYDGEQVCVTEPIVFMRAEGFEVVHEIPVGTCLEDEGRTEFVVSN